MRFTTAWADTVSQNQILKVTVGLLSVISVVLSVCASTLGMREPLVIERGCFSATSQPVSSKNTPKEIEGFLKEALPYRFDSDITPKLGFLSLEEDSFRRKEQEDLSVKKITQKILIRSVKVEEELLSVDADRLLAFGDIRSAFHFPLEVRLATVSRSESNPYGLILSKVSSKTSKEPK